MWESTSSPRRWHSSVGGALSALQQQGCEVDLVDIRRDGTIDLEHLRELSRKDTVLVAVCAVDSELGTVQPIREIADILRDYPNCCLRVDATQAVGKTKLVFSGVDTMSIAPHKFYGLNGSGLLVKKKDLVIETQIHGGGSTTPYRSGTPALWAWRCRSRRRCVWRSKIRTSASHTLRR